MVHNGWYMRRWAFYCTNFSIYYVVCLYSQSFNFNHLSPNALYTLLN